jgi:glycosyltransferase involved in cell wall biosynthesis
MNVSVIIPAYNEEESIQEVIRRVEHAVPGAEIIVVDDGSTDKTYEIAKKTGVKVISYKPNKGKTFALKTGYENALNDIIVNIDADSSYPPEEIPNLLKKIELRKADLVVGSRFAKGFAKGLSWYRNLANIFGACIVSLIVLKRVTDVTSGLRAFRKELTKLPIKAKGLEYEAEFTTKVITLGYKYEEVPISFEKRKGGSKLKLLRDCFKFLFAALRGRFS